MSVKVIVTDMDGTFLNDAKTYNQPRFMAQYQELKKRGIKFVVASGNQYYQLISFFPELKDEIDPLRLTLKSLCGKSAVSERHYWRAKSG